MIPILFVLSAVATLLFLFSMLLSRNIPVPILHIWNVGFNHSFIYTPALAFQVWWWSNHFGLI